MAAVSIVRGSPKSSNWVSRSNCGLSIRMADPGLYSRYVRSRSAGQVETPVSSARKR